MRIKMLSSNKTGRYSLPRLRLLDSTKTVFCYTPPLTMHTPSLTTLNSGRHVVTWFPHQWKKERIGYSTHTLCGLLREYVAQCPPLPQTMKTTSNSLGLSPPYVCWLALLDSSVKWRHLSVCLSVWKVARPWGAIQKIKREVGALSADACPYHFTMDFFFWLFVL